MSGCEMLADVSGLRIELPQVEKTGCFGAALADRVGTGVYRVFSEAQRDYRTRYAPCCRI
ncbi:hypothetical protein ACLK19_24160 [Escherichia coli]